MTVKEWIRAREISGLPTFSFDEVRVKFSNLSEQIIKNDLHRLSLQKIIVTVYKGFYVIIPPQYAAKGIVPPTYYIDQLMNYLNKPYYICLLNAAALMGAAHQRPQIFSVMTVFPKVSVSPLKNNLIAWSYRKTISKELLLTKNSETGIISYSNPELTALDLVQYEQYIGGLSRVATVLEELTEQTDFSKANDVLFNYTTIATLQRLGFILDTVIEMKSQAAILYDKLCKYSERRNYVPLSTRHPNAGSQRDSKWKIIINTNIEVDDI